MKVYRFRVWDNWDIDIIHESYWDTEEAAKEFKEGYLKHYSGKSEKSTSIAEVKLNQPEETISCYGKPVRIRFDPEYGKMYLIEEGTKFFKGKEEWITEYELKLKESSWYVNYNRKISKEYEDNYDYDEYE